MERGQDKTTHAEPERQVTVMQPVEEPARDQGTSGLAERQGNALEPGNRPIGPFAEVVGHHLGPQGGEHTEGRAIEQYIQPEPHRARSQNQHHQAARLHRLGQDPR